MRKKSLIILLVLSLFTLGIIHAEAASNAKTLKELRSELQALKNKKSSAEYKKTKTKEQISSAKSDITSSQNAIEKGKQQIAEATKQIEELTNDIELSKDKMRALMNAYQKSEGDNLYLEYLFESESYADFVYRYTIIKQIADYTEGQINEMQDKIITNEELKVELANKEVELNNKIASLEKSLDSLGSQLDEIAEETMDIQDEIDSTQELIDYYVKMGCGENEDLDVCVSVKGDTGFRKPLTKGTITSYYGYRINPVSGLYKLHSGTDIGGNSEGTNVYSTANGMVGKIIRKASCGGNQVYIYHTINGKQYTSGYMHLLTINVSVGDKVTSNTVIGTVGGGPKTFGWETCSTGAHLHFMLANGWYGKTYTNWSTFISKTLNAKDILNLPNKYTYWYKR